jgi:cyanoexosortase A
MHMQAINLRAFTAKLLQIRSVSSWVSNSIRSRFLVYASTFLHRIPPPTPRNIWLFLSLLVATQSCAVFYSSQSANVSILAAMIWGGALICIEDQLEDLRPQPRLFGLISGSILLVWVLARTSVILHWDGFLFLLAPLAGFALTLLCFPISDCHRFRDPLLCLMLLPAFALLVRVLPESPLSLATAQGAGLWLSLLGLDVVVQGRHVLLPGGGVEVLAACNGLDMIAQIMCIAMIFMLAFRISSVLSRCLLFLAAPLIALVCNTFRIALLAFFSGSGHGKGSSLFSFFHNDSGSLIFSAVAVFFFGLLYMRLLERELPPITTSSGQEDS